MKKINSQIRRIFLSFLLFSVQAVYGAKYDEIKAHGSLMVFAWIFFASNAIILARYYRRLLPSKHICGYPVWFPFHFFCAILTAACSLSAFLVILAEKKWNWLSTTNSVNFSHSIVGIIGIGFAFMQFVYSLCRPSLGSSARQCFNIIHATIGMIAFAFSTTAILIALFIDRVHLSWPETGIMMGWIFWCFVVFSLLEILRYFDTRYLLKVALPDTYPNEVHNRFDQVRNVILAVQLVISLGCATAMLVFIVLTKPTEFVN